MDAIKWTAWSSLGRPAEAGIGRPLVQHNLDGRLELFALGSGAIFNIAQVAPNGSFRNEWRNKDRPASNVQLTSHIVSRNADGRQEIFGLGDDGGIWQKWQLAPNDGWSEWHTLGKPRRDVSPTEQLAIGRNQDGRQELFTVGTDRNVWQIWQTAPNGGWSDWRTLGRPPKEIRQGDRITVGNNLDGRQELFVIGGDGALWHIRQVAPNVGWGDWETLGRPRDDRPPTERDMSEPLVCRNADGHLEVFSPGNGAFCNRWQEGPNSSVWRHEGWNVKPRPQPGVGIMWLDAALNIGGHRPNHLEVFALGDNGELWHAWQIDQAPNWSAWDSLGSPPATIRAADRLTVGTNQDGHLEVFLMGLDLGVWHTSQIR